MSSVLYVALLVCVLQESPRSITDSNSFSSLVERARIEYWTGRFGEAESLLTTALRNFPSIDETQRARALSELGDVLVNLDELQKAERVYMESFAIYKRSDHKAALTLLLRNLGALYSLQGRDEEALQILQQALKTARTADQAGSQLTGHVLNNIGVVYYRQRNMSKAEKFFKDALRSLSSSGVASKRADLLNNLGVIYHSKREFQKSEDYLTQGLRITEAIVGATHPDVTFSLSAMGVLYTDMRRYAEAEALYQRALAILEPDAPVFETRIARLLHSLSVTYAQAGRRAEADATQARAATLARRNVGKHPDMALIMDAFAVTLKKGGKLQEAEELRREAKRARVAADLVINAIRPF